MEYDFAFQASGESFLTGSFSAEDLNNDNFIRDDELISLSFSNDTYSIEDYSNTSTSWATLNFNFDIRAAAFVYGGTSTSRGGQSWYLVNGVGLGYGKGSGCAGFAYDGTFQGCIVADPWTGFAQEEVETFATVPTPSTLAIFALGFMALAARRFKKQS